VGPGECRCRDSRSCHASEANRGDEHEAGLEVCGVGPGERIFRKQFVLEPASVSLSQTNNTLNLMDGLSLQEARAKLDEVIAIKEERRRREVGAPIEEGRDHHHSAIIASQPGDSKPAEAEPVRQVPKHAGPLSERQKQLAQSRRMGVPMGKAKAFFDRRARGGTGATLGFEPLDFNPCLDI
jgi:hypothetical protein